MSELPRLIEAADEFERELIRAAQHDQPSARAFERTLVSLGVGVTSVPVAVASAAPGSAAISKLSAAVLGKWLLAGVALGLATAGGAELARSAHPPAHRPFEAAARTAPLPIRVHAKDRVPPAQSAPAAASEPSPAAPALVPAPDMPRSGPLSARYAEPPAPVSGRSADSAQRAFAVEPPALPVTTLERETRLVDAARVALARGDANGALATLASYEHAFPNGALRPEAAVLKVRALLGAGDRAGAEALGRRIVAQAPRSEHADAIRAALEQATKR